MVKADEALVEVADEIVLAAALLHDMTEDTDTTREEIADKTCNLRSILSHPPKDWSAQRQHDYFQWARQVVDGLLGENPALDQEVNRVLDEGLERRVRGRPNDQRPDPKAE